MSQMCVSLNSNTTTDSSTFFYFVTFPTVYLCVLRGAKLSRRTPFFQFSSNSRETQLIHLLIWLYTREIKLSFNPLLVCLYLRYIYHLFNEAVNSDNGLPFRGSKGLNSWQQRGLNFLPFSIPFTHPYKVLYFLYKQTLLHKPYNLDGHHRTF